jgi:hypothetical protein
VNGRADKFVGVSDNLADRYIIARLHYRLTGRADMHLHWNYNLFRCRNPDDFKIGGVFTVVYRNTAPDFLDSCQDTGGYFTHIHFTSPIYAEIIINCIRTADAAI